MATVPDDVDNKKRLCHILSITHGLLNRQALLLAEQAHKKRQEDDPLLEDYRVHATLLHVVDQLPGYRQDGSPLSEYVAFIKQYIGQYAFWRLIDDPKFMETMCETIRDCQVDRTRLRPCSDKKIIRAYTNIVDHILMTNE